MSSINYDELMQPVLAFLGAKPQKNGWMIVNNLDILMQDHANCEKKQRVLTMNLMFRYSFSRTYKLSLPSLYVKKCFTMNKF